jgi:hypothetical protein
MHTDKRRSMQALAEDMEGQDAMTSSRKGSKGKNAGKAATVSGKDTVYLLALHEQHQLDTPDARSRPNAEVDEFAGMQRRGGKGRWLPPAFPMCVVHS